MKKTYTVEEDSPFRFWVRGIWYANVKEHEEFNESTYSMEEYWAKYKYWLKREYKHQRKTKY